MKVAVVSDIHANRHAFEATLDAVAASEAEWGSHGSVAARKTTSTELLAPLPAKRLARPYVAVARRFMTLD